jgi:peptidase S41-like protein
MPKLRSIEQLLPAIRLAHALVPLLLVAFAVQAAAAPPELPAIGGKDRQAIVADIIGALDKAYVFPEVARKMAARLRQQLGSGAYDRLTTLPAFAEQLTEDLQAVGTR